MILLLFVEHPLDFAVAHGHADYVIQHPLRDECLGRQIQRLPQRRAQPSHQIRRVALVGNPRFLRGALLHRRKVGDEISVQADVFQLLQALKVEFLQAGDAVGAEVDVPKVFGQGRVANHHARQVARGNQQILQVRQTAHEIDVLHADRVNLHPHEVLRLRQRGQIEHKVTRAFIADNVHFLQLRHFAQHVVAVRDNRAIPLPDALDQPRAAQFVDGRNRGVFGQQLADGQVRQRGQRRYAGVADNQALQLRQACQRRNARDAAVADVERRQLRRVLRDGRQVAFRQAAVVEHERRQLRQTGECLKVDRPFVPNCQILQIREAGELRKVDFARERLAAHVGRAGIIAPPRVHVEGIAIFQFALVRQEGEVDIALQQPHTADSRQRIRRDGLIRRNRIAVGIQEITQRRFHGGRHGRGGGCFGRNRRGGFGRHVGWRFRRQGGRYLGRRVCRNRRRGFGRGRSHRQGLAAAPKLHAHAHHNQHQQRRNADQQPLLMLARRGRGGILAV